MSRKPKAAPLLGAFPLFLVLAAPALAAPLPPSGSTTYSAMLTCRKTVNIDMGEFGHQSAAECVGISTQRAEGRWFDNLAVRCFEEEESRVAAYKFIGWCAQIDGDGDKFYTSYDGVEAGEVSFIGGTGKYKSIAVGGQWSVKDSPDLGDGGFGFTLDYKIDWRAK